jgi:hypothetical protein
LRRNRRSVRARRDRQATVPGSGLQAGRPGGLARIHVLQIHRVALGGRQRGEPEPLLPIQLENLRHHASIEGADVREENIGDVPSVESPGQASGAVDTLSHRIQVGALQSFQGLPISRGHAAGVRIIPLPIREIHRHRGDTVAASCQHGSNGIPFCGIGSLRQEWVSEPAPVGTRREVVEARLVPDDLRLELLDADLVQVPVRPGVVPQRIAGRDPHPEGCARFRLPFHLRPIHEAVHLGHTRRQEGCDDPFGHTSASFPLRERTVDGQIVHGDRQVGGGRVRPGGSRDASRHHESEEAEDQCTMSTHDAPCGVCSPGRSATAIRDDLAGTDGNFHFLTVIDRASYLTPAAVEGSGRSRSGLSQRFSFSRRRADRRRRRRPGCGAPNSAR